MVGSADGVEEEPVVGLAAEDEAAGMDLDCVVFFNDFFVLFLESDLLLLLLLLLALLLALGTLLDDADVTSADVFFPPEARRRAKLAFFSFCRASTAAIFFSCFENLGPKGEPSSCWPTSQSLRASRK